MAEVPPRGEYSAAPSALGYFYQVRCAMLEALRRLRKSSSFSVAIETLDDVVFEKVGGPPELLQTKHHVNQAADLTDASVDLWKTLRNWCDAVAQGTISEGTMYILLTTAKAAEGHAAYYLKLGDSRNIDAAIQRLNSTAASSTNRSNAPGYAAYRALEIDQRKALLDKVFVLDSSPQIQDLDQELKELLFFAVEHKFLESFLQRLEGWWFRRAIKHLVADDANPILGEELDAEIASIREQFKQESLPIDDDIMSASVDASGYQDHVFVHQLRLIEIGNKRISYAIQNFFRAFKHRSRWMREDLLLVGELDRYEDRLVEEWDLFFQQVKDELGEAAAEEAKMDAAKTLYKWVETRTQPMIRNGVTEPFVARGTYQILSDEQRVGWHIEFKERLRQILESEEATA